MPPAEEITLREEKLKQGKSGSREGNERRLDQRAGFYSSHQSSATPPLSRNRRSWNQSTRPFWERCDGGHEI